jgi:stage II sporulation protein R
MLELAEELFKDTKDYIEAKEIAEKNIDILRQNAKETLAKNGCDSEVSVTVGKAWFGTREYEDFTLPAGEYDALRIVIGEGEGKNWWCVMFPAVCLPAAKGDIEDALDSPETEIVKGGKKYKAAFKIVEIYESVKRFFKK